MMKKLYSFFFLLMIICDVVKSQIPFVATTSFWAKKDVFSEIKKDMEKLNKVGFRNSYQKSANSDTLLYYIRNDVEEVRIKYVFNIPLIQGDSEVNYYCGYEEVAFDCSPCASKHTKQMLDDKAYKFRKLSENKYLSKYSWHTEMGVFENKGAKECLIFTFKYFDKPKKEFKQLYNSLEKININEKIN